MSIRRAFLLGILTALSVIPGSTLGHVPYLEDTDLSLRAPFHITNIEQSIAVYAWLETGQDIDVYYFQIDRPTRVLVEMLVPAFPAYRSFFPAFALIGPDLPAPTIQLGGGWGIRVFAWEDQGSPRDSFYEPFGGKSYYEGPGLDETLVQPGLYTIVVWDPGRTGGDYVLTPGFLERFGLPDLNRALTNTPLIRANEELHLPRP